MQYTEHRFWALRCVALCRAQPGETLAELVEAGLVGYANHAYHLTSVGTEYLQMWDSQDTLTHVPGLAMKQARRLWRCICADRYTGYEIEMIYPAHQVPGVGQKITRRVAYRVDGSGAHTYARELKDDNPELDVVVAGVPNAYYMPGCLGDIRPGDVYADYAEDGIHTGERYCLSCASARFTERQVDHV